MLAPVYNKIFGLFFQGTSLIFKDNYPLFGNYLIMPVKILWDWMVYWTISGHIIMQGRVTEPLMCVKHFGHIKKLNGMSMAMQAHFCRWHAEHPSFETSGLINTSNVNLIIDTNRKLEDELDKDAYAERFASNVAQMETLFWEIVDYSPIEMQSSYKRSNHPGAVKNGFLEVMEVASKRPCPAGEPGSVPMDRAVAAV